MGVSNLPLVLDRTVALATLVNWRLALTLQLAMNQNRQKTDASCAVCRVVRGSRAPAFRTSSECTDGERKFDIKAEVGASSESTATSAS